ncbi:hypothetical protein WJ562_004081 [Salmonella enterica]|nr:hypothetical protein [Salmonella enterica]
MRLWRIPGMPARCSAFLTRILKLHFRLRRVPAPLTISILFTNDMASDDGRVVQVQVSRLRAADVYRVFDMQAQRVRPVAEQAKLIMETARRRPLPPVTNIVAFEQRDGDDLLVISGKRVKVVRVLSELMNRYPAFTQEFAEVIDKIKKH